MSEGIGLVFRAVQARKWCGTRAALLVAAFLLCPAWMLVRADITTPRTTALEVHLLNPAEARQHEAVHLTGVVTALSGWKSSFFLQDATSGISINRRGSVPELHPGDRVVVDGVTDPGNFAPMVVNADVRVVGHGALPHAPSMAAANLAWGVQDSQWVSIQGAVRSVERKKIWNRSIYVLAINIGTADLLTAQIYAEPKQNIASLAGASITVRGVCGTIWNDRRQFAGLRLFVNSEEDIHVDRPSPADPFDLPFRQVDGLMQYGHATSGLSMVKIQGAVTAVLPQSGFYLQDNAGGILVSDKLDTVRVGQELQVVGYPSVTDATPMLQATYLRQIGSASPAPQVLPSLNDIFAVDADFSTVRFESMLVELTGKLLEYSEGRNGGTLLLDTPNGVFSALLPSGGKHDAWQAGSVLRVRGICVASDTDDNAHSTVQLRLRSASDVTVLQRASWWTAQRALWLTGALAAVLLLTLVWVAVLRRQARLQALVATDPLTGLYNRRGFLLVANKQIEVLQRRRGAFLLFFFDVNRFKQINDTFGHRAGDAALRDIAATLKQVFRDADVLCRLGGDEFAVFATDAAGNAEEVLKTRLHDSIEQLNRQSGREFRLTLSMGALFCEKDCLNRPIEDLLEQADALMYEHKRNRPAEHLAIEA